MRRTSLTSMLLPAAGLCAVLLWAVILLVPRAAGQVPPDDDPPVPPASLSTVPAPEPPNLSEFVLDREAAQRLGKALFWDMQIGSDGMTACASCHFHAGADNRIKNQLSPGSMGTDLTFTTGRPNYTLRPEDFPFRALSDPEDRRSPVLRDSNDVVSSQGAFFSQYHRLRIGFRADGAGALVDPVFSVQGVNTRRVEQRNTPTVINAVYNSRNFWDGRASDFFNGVSIWGPLDERSGIFVVQEGVLTKQTPIIPLASLASQALAPPLSDLEMSASGRSWPLIGRKLLNLRPLANQFVHPEDSKLGPLSRARKLGAGLSGQRGLNTTYRLMIQSAFQPQYWSSAQVVRFEEDGTTTILAAPAQALQANEFTQMEANYSFFFGLALQMYQATLVSDETPFDRFLEGQATAITPRQQEGFAVFMNQGRCIACHSGAPLTNASVKGVELMPTADGGISFYDEGFYNIAVRPRREDPGVGRVSAIINPRTNEPYPLSLSRMGLLKRQGLLPAAVDALTPALPAGDGFPDPLRVSVTNAFKTPGLRNVELTGPYFHTGGQATLRQVVDFYDRGGDFRDEEITTVHPEILDLNLTEAQKVALVDFMLALTDERVRLEKAPFDHPQLFLSHGQRGDQNAIEGDEKVERNGFRNNEEWFELPAVGAGGRTPAGLPPLGRFLDLDPFAP